jgi:hypothetical protein
VDLAGKNGRNLVFYQVWFQTISQSGFAWTLINEDMFSVIPFFSLSRWVKGMPGTGKEGGVWNFGIHFLLSQIIQWPGHMLSMFFLRSIQAVVMGDNFPSFT